MTAPQPLLAGRYRLLKVEDEGGFGKVYEAVDTNLDRPCAIKTIPFDSEAKRGLIEQEVAILRRHAAERTFIPEFYNYWFEAGVAYIVMEWIEGPTVWDLLCRDEAFHRWEVARVLRFLHALLDHLDELHARDIVHRDLKPQNIKRHPDRYYVLIDFGLAKVGFDTLSVARGAGTHFFIAPEQRRGLPTDARADLYSLGAIAYLMLTGQLPPLVEARWAGTPLTPPSDLVPGIPCELEQAVLRMMEMEPGQRPGSAAEALTLLAPPAPVAPPVPAAPPAPVRPAKQAGFGRETLRAIKRDLRTYWNVYAAAAFVGMVVVWLLSLATTDARAGAWVVLLGLLLPAFKRPIYPRGALLDWAVLLLVGLTAGALASAIFGVVLGGWMVGFGIFQAQIPANADRLVVFRRRLVGRYGWWTVLVPLILLIVLLAAVGGGSEPSDASSGDAARDTAAVATEEVGARAQARALFAAATPAAGPTSGTLEHDVGTGKVAFDRGSTDLRDAIVSASFVNPYEGQEGAWDYGFFFRRSDTGEYRLVVDSRGRWVLLFNTGGSDAQSTIVDEGTVSDLDTGDGGRNRLELYVEGRLGLFFVNGRFVATLDLTRSLDPGDVLIGTGFYQGNAQSGQSTRYEDFSIYALSR